MASTNGLPKRVRAFRGMSGPHDLRRVELRLRSLQRVRELLLHVAKDVALDIAGHGQQCDVIDVTANHFRLTVAAGLFWVVRELYDAVVRDLHQLQRHCRGELSGLHLHLLQASQMVHLLYRVQFSLLLFVDVNGFSFSSQNE